MERPTATQRVERSLTLLWTFVVASAALLAAAAAVLGTVLAGALRSQSVDDAKTSLTQYANGVLAPRLLSGDEIRVGAGAARIIDRELAERPDILSVKVWRPDGVLAWASLDEDRVGTRFPLEGHLAEVLETGRPEGELETLGDEAEHGSEAKLGVDRVLEVYAPLLVAGRVVGAYEFYADAAPIEASIAAPKQTIWIAVAAVFAGLWLLLALLVRGASRMFRRQTQALRERSAALAASYEQLEASSLEAVQTLNATVEARDPYTAGHSHRTQQVALAIADELGMPEDELDALRFGALFHDVGKIAIPDRILAKPDRLTLRELEVMKGHPEAGASIVERLGRLRESVPIIRHHHERWDGRGYPDGLAREEIPLAAAVTGLADAWDAMTTDRPHHRALTTAEALAQVRAGRGTQFAPDVVDAFLAVLEREPPAFAAGYRHPLATAS